MTTTDAFGHRAIWKIAAPMMLSGISVPLLGLVDTAVLGHLDSAEYLAAVAVGATIFSLLFMSLNFLRMGTTGLTAQALGANDRVRQFSGLQQALIVALCIATVLVLAKQPILKLALHLIAPDESVGELASVYFNIRIFSAPLALANFVIIGWLLGMQDGRGPLIITLVLNITNIVLDLLFVVGMGMTVDGVALATLLAEVVALVAGLWLVAKQLRQLNLRSKLLQWPGGEPIGRLLDVNGSLFVRTLTLMFTFAFVTAQGARLGDVILATNALLMNFLFLLSYALDGIANAAEALTGKAYGQNNSSGLQQAVSRSLQWSLLFAAGFTLVYAVFGQSLIDLLTSLPDVQNSASKFLPWIVALPFVTFLSFLYDGVFVGLTRTREMCFVMLAATFMVFLPTWYLCQAWGNHALWFALILFMAARSLGMHVWYGQMIKQRTVLGEK